MDLDLGNYERFLDITLRRDNNLTTGKIYQVWAAQHAYGHAHVLIQLTPLTACD